MLMRTRLLVASVVLLSACTSTGKGVTYYFVSYADASAYRGEADEAGLDRCAALDGANRQGQDDSHPPSGITVTFEGSDDDRSRLEKCLRSLPNVRVIDSAKEGDPSPPRLVG
jgi:hypothetical protein